MYNAFISYSQAADGKMAPAIQSALERFAKPWFKKRNLNVFRDLASLSANPHLWPNIQKALDKSEYMIYLASPVSASSKWVKKEIEYWLAHKSIDNLLIVLTEGEISWDYQNKSFLNPDANSLPALLESKFTEEPFYIDLRQLRTHHDLSLQNPLFKKEILRLAAPLHGKEPKDLASEEVTVHRKMMRIRNAAIIILIFLFIAAVGAAFIANIKANEAIRERNIAQANYHISEAKTATEKDPTLALRLAEVAMLEYDEPYVKDVATKIFRENLFYKIIARHDRYISSTALSPGKDMVLTGCWDGIARLWDLKGRLIREFTGHSRRVTSVAFSPDGNAILTGSEDGTACLWDLEGVAIQKFEGHFRSVNSVVFSPDGKTIFTGSDDNTGRLWDLKGNTLQKFGGHSGDIRSVQFSPDGKSVLTCSYDSTARMWDLKGNTLQEFKGHSGFIYSVTFSPDGKTILTASADKTACLWDLKGVMLQKFQHNAEVSAVAFSPGGKEVLTGSFDGEVSLSDLNGNSLKEFKGHSYIVSSLVFLSERTILTGSYDKTCRSWDLKGNILEEFNGHSNYINKIAFTPDGKRIVTTSGDSTFRLWDLQGNALQVYKNAYISKATSLVFSTDGRTILTGSEFRYSVSPDTMARLWDLKGNVIREFKGHSNHVTSAVFSPDGKTILTGSYDSTARLWDLNGNTLQVFKGLADGISSVAFSSDGKIILAVPDNGIFCLFDLKGTKLLEYSGGYTSESQVKSVVFSPVGQTVLINYGDTLSLWNLKGDTLMSFKGLPNTNFESAVFAPDGNSILTLSGNNTAQLWDLKGNQFQELKSHLFRIMSVVFSPDGKSILTACDDDIARLWEVTSTVSEFLKTDKIEPLSVEQKKMYGIK